MIEFAAHWRLETVSDVIICHIHERNDTDSSCIYFKFSRWSYIVRKLTELPPSMLEHLSFSYRNHGYRLFHLRRRVWLWRHRTHRQSWMLTGRSSFWSNIQIDTWWEAVEGCFLSFNSFLKYLRGSPTGLLMYRPSLLKLIQWFFGYIFTDGCRLLYFSGCTNGN